ncbi:MULTISPECIES: thioesterase family protein [Pseudomonas]|uniref:Putative thioesterase n=1 Tax=Pseudomonas asplenii TaxID=53407 RepID=A0A0N0VK00_9PSED|nr:MULTISPECIES: hotdog domain-containing protein [Pseudomonas]KPA90979.1 putative thioesterase [Pseudomonas fuscovaginae]KPA95037.1 putative thioesterase [Pseudomonas fuscovaginae]
MPDLIGRIGLLRHTVQPIDLATHWNNDIPALATPILLWLSELAAMMAIEGLLPDTLMTVGIAHDSQHLAPTPAGFTLSVRATVIQATDKSIEFAVEASDGSERILSGLHTRAVVDRKAFKARVANKHPGLQP